MENNRTALVVNDYADENKVNSRIKVRCDVWLDDCVLQKCYVIVTKKYVDVKKGKCVHAYVILSFQDEGPSQSKGLILRTQLLYVSII